MNEYPENPRRELRQRQADTVLDPASGILSWSAGRRFALQRTQDVTGVSGTGTVATGIEFPDGSVAIRWAGPTPSTVMWSSVDDAMRVHGHGGLTTIEWAD